VAVGLHGLELRRSPDTEPDRSRVGSAPGALRAEIARIAAGHRVELVEDKGAAIAIHHRFAAPAMQALRRALQAACHRHAPDWTVLRGRQVLEIKPAHATKAHGVDALMAFAPFSGTVPIAFGDDVTDLDMFEAIRRHGGTTVAVGPRIVGSGDLQLDAPGESLELLEAMCAELDNGGDARRIDAVLRHHAHA